MEPLEADTSSSKARWQLLAVALFFGAVLLKWAVRKGAFLSRWLSGVSGLVILLVMSVVIAKLLSTSESTEDNGPALRISEDGIKDNRLGVFIHWKDVESVKQYSDQFRGVRIHNLHIDLKNKKKYLDQVSLFSWFNFATLECDFMINITNLDTGPGTIEQRAKTFLREHRDAA